MSYSWDRTICVFTQDSDVIEQTEVFAEKYKMNIFIAENDVDLVAVPCWLAIVDINLMSNDVLNFIEEMNKKSDIEIDGEVLSISTTPKFITHTRPNFTLPLSLNLNVVENISVDILSQTCLKFIPSL